MPEPEDDRLVTATAILSLPAETYAGHTVCAMDESIFTVDGVGYSASRAYAEGLASNKFEIVEPALGSIIRLNDLKSVIVFNEAGLYSVRLCLTLNDGTTIYDIKLINVLETPSITANLAGAQKQNRKQIINVTIAQNSLAPIKNLTIEIINNDNNESVVLTHPAINESESEGALNDIACIYTRPLELLDCNEEFLNCRLAFLTKNASPTVYTYIIYAEDINGETDVLEADFEVVEDIAPVAGIEIADRFIRNKSSNIASIKASSATETDDGDYVKCNWLVDVGDGSFEDIESVADFSDLSFGKKQSVGFSKTGVGFFTLRLDVRDEWSEETLEEYVTEEDHLSDSTYVIREVVNVAPVISLEIIDIKPADILMLAGGTEELEYLTRKTPSLKQALLKKGIDAKISIEKSKPEPAIGGDEYVDVAFDVDTSFGHQGEWSFFEDKNFSVDESCLYKIDATWLGAGVNDYPQAPYTISAWDLDGEVKKWSYTFTEDIMMINYASKDTYFGHDDTGKFLYFVSDANTLILDKMTGSPLTLLNTSLGKFNYVEDNYIFTMKNDGIYAIDLTNGNIKKEYSAHIRGESRRIGGLVNFLKVDGTKLYRTIFNINNRKIIASGLPGSESDQGTFSYMGYVDIEGTMTIVANDGSEAPITRIYDCENRLIKTISKTASGKVKVTPVHNASGKITYVAYSYQYRNGNYFSYVDIFDLYSDYYSSTGVSSSSGYTTVTDNVIFAKELDEVVYVITGAEYVYVYNTGYNIYPQRTANHKFIPSEETSTVSNNFGMVTGFGSIVEYGYSSDIYTAVQTGNNNQNYDGTHGSETSVITWPMKAGAIMERYFEKYLTSNNTEQRIQAVLSYDNSWLSLSADDSGLDDLINKLKDGGCRLYLSSKYGTPENFSDLTGQTEGCILRAGEGLIDALAEQIVESAGLNELPEGMIQRKALEIEAKDEGDGFFSRSFSTGPGNTYYFEYDAKRSVPTGAATMFNDGGGPDAIYDDIFTVEHKVSSDITQGLIEGEYRVSQTEVEDFNNPEFNDYFSFAKEKINNGLYSAAAASGYGSENRYFEAVDTITFDVPAGKQAILSFNFEIMKESTSYQFGNYFKIDDNYWSMANNTQGSGHYTHMTLLEGGLTHTLYSYAGGYGNRYSKAHTYLDDICVEYVEYGGESSIDDVNILSITNDGDWDKVSGMFNSPQPIVAYQNFDAIVLSDITDGNEYTSSSGDDSHKYLSLHVPTGMTSVYTDIGIYGHQTYAYRESYYKTVPFTWLDLEWICYPHAYVYPEQALNFAPSSYNIILPQNITGDHIISGLFYNAPRYKTVAEFDSVKMIMTDYTNELIADRRYFADWQKGELYLPNKKFNNQTKVSFKIPAGTSLLLKNLKIYTIINGERVYVTDDSLNGIATVSKWDEADVNINIKNDIEAKPDEKIIFNKGELVKLNLIYNDHEGDPELDDKYYYRYVHYPYNDGVNPDAAVVIDNTGNISGPGAYEKIPSDGLQSLSNPAISNVMNVPIQRFYIDGKYVLQAWTKDDTSYGSHAGGNPNYDKYSNVAEITFYIEPGSVSSPWIKTITTSPIKVQNGQNFSVKVTYDDIEKDVLSLTTEIYKGDAYFTNPQTVTGLVPDASGVYPEVEVINLPAASIGRYTVVCTVRDSIGAGIKHFVFTVASAPGIAGIIDHTDRWDSNRRCFNLLLFGEEMNYKMNFEDYLTSVIPRGRGSNVFWSGEKYIIRAAVGGAPREVTVQIEGYAYVTGLKASGFINDSGEEIFKGELWDKSMINLWGQKVPEKINFLFIAKYSDGVEKEHVESVIMDDLMRYHNLHRAY